MEDMLTTEQAARVLKLHVKRVQALARAGRLPAARIGRKWLFPRGQLAARLGRHGSPLARIEISGRNQLQGVVTEVKVGDVMAEIQVNIGGQAVTSIITRSSVERLGLRIGDTVLVIVKATDVMIGRP